LVGYFKEDQNAWGGFVGALYAIGIVAAGMFGKSLLTAAPGLYSDKVKANERLTDDKNKLIDTAKPRLAFIFEHGKEPFEHTEPALTTEKAMRIFRVGVKNAGSVRLNNCSLKLCEMTNTTNVFLPIALKQRDDNPTPAPPPTSPVILGFSQMVRTPSDNYKQTFALNPNELIYFDLVSLDERDEVKEIQLHYARSPLVTPRGVPRGDYCITLRAFADIGGESEGHFTIFVQDGRLRVLQSFY
jgi:hypothetical protein